MNQVTEIRPGVFAIEDGSVRMYLICGKTSALLLDTGFGSAGAMEAVKTLYTGPVQLAHTHAHFDHVGGDRAFSRVFAHPAEWPDIIQQTGIAEEALSPLKEGDVFDLGGRSITVIETPGHTKGSLSFLDKQNRLFFTGDNVSDATVYICLPGADLDEYEKSLRRILAMQGQYDTLLGCHGQIELSVGQAQRMLDCVAAIRDGRAASERCNAYDDFWFDKRSWQGASIFLPLTQ